MREGSYRRSHEIPAYASAAKDGHWLTMTDAADTLGVPHSAIRKLIQRGVLLAKQVLPDAPWQIMAEDL